MHPPSSRVQVVPLLEPWFWFSCVQRGVPSDAELHPICVHPAARASATAVNSSAKVRTVFVLCIAERLQKRLEVAGCDGFTVTNDRPAEKQIVERLGF